MGTLGTPSAFHASEIRYRRLFEASQDGIPILNAVTLEARYSVQVPDIAGRRLKRPPRASGQE
ncbi:MAG: hypothetical protein ABIR33_04480 [Pyrinomonadaceae bacterium]